MKSANIIPCDCSSTYMLPKKHTIFVGGKDQYHKYHFVYCSRCGSCGKYTSEDKVREIIRNYK